MEPAENWLNAVLGQLGVSDVGNLSPFRKHCPGVEPCQGLGQSPLENVCKNI